MKHRRSRKDEGPLRYALLIPSALFLLGRGLMLLTSVRAFPSPRTIIIARAWLFLDIWSLPRPGTSVCHMQLPPFFRMLISYYACLQPSILIGTHVDLTPRCV